jgi:hypothetical protein
MTQFYGPSVPDPIRGSGAISVATLDHDRREVLDESIQNGCGALLALHACARSVAVLPGDHDDVQQELEVAIELVRAAVDQLQMLPAEPPGLPTGFVGRSTQARRDLD